MLRSAAVALLLLSPLAAEPAPPAVAQPEQCLREGPAQHGDTASLLQRPRKARRGPAGRGRRGAAGGPALAERAPKEAVALQGGGFRSFAIYTGVTAGLLRAGHLSLQGLFQRYDTLAAASGGTWFALQLIYSERFRKLQEKLAVVKPCHAGPTFRLKWVAKWVLRLATLLPGLLPSGNGCFPAFDWQSFNGALHGATAGITEDVVLGSPVQRWAKGKLFLPVAAVMLPGLGVLEAANSTRAFLLSSEQVVVSYRGQAADPRAGFLPARFSARLGAGRGARSELGFCGAPDCAGARLVFSAPGSGAPATTPRLSEVYAEAFRDGGRLPALAVAAASSAFSFDTLLLAPAACNQSAASVLNGVPVARAPAAGAFAAARAQVARLFGPPPGGPGRFALEAMAPAGFGSLVDAGAADNDAVLTAVASGASVVTSLGFNTEDLVNLFRGGSEGGFFGGGFPFQYFQIFAEPVAFARRAIRGFRCLKTAVGGGGGLVDSFCFGSLKATTVDNVLAGVEGGRTVTINVISVTTEVPNQPALDVANPLSNLDYSNYSRLVGDISMIMAASKNRKMVKDLLAEFFAT